ncbi:hypothetical protein SLEP1_g29477 [Rubroshorea leprosula]|uniref:Uncharacterized protein n=1 Tax=Rubroshorea leprosula TaxID=152421 RepID=A0AAV5K7N7_9ROSI|nr:hypothetical protein SLEP1_g29477 [Rubroshorea leprosula]
MPPKRNVGKVAQTLQIGLGEGSPTHLEGENEPIIPPPLSPILREHSFVNPTFNKDSKSGDDIAQSGRCEDLPSTIDLKFVKDVLSGQQLWQSFEHRVNTFLPGAGIGYDLETGMDSTYSRAISLVLNNDQESENFYISLNTTDRASVILSEGTLKIMCWGKDTGCCLEGFVPKSDEEWNKNNWTEGCIRRTELSCLARTSLEASQGEETDKFWEMNAIELPDKSKYQEVKDVNECGQWKLRVDLITSLRTVSCIISLGALVYGLCWQRSKTIGKKDQTLENFDPDARRESPWDTLLESMLRSIVRKGEPQELPLFDFYSIAVVTKNFSMANKLGQGGYGPVYKGKPHDETDIAVKRLSSSQETL